MEMAMLDTGNNKLPKGWWTLSKLTIIPFAYQELKNFEYLFSSRIS